MGSCVDFELSVNFFFPDVLVICVDSLTLIQLILMLSTHFYIDCKKWIWLKYIVQYSVNIQGTRNFSTVSLSKGYFLLTRQFSKLCMPLMRLKMLFLLALCMIMKFCKRGFCNLTSKLSSPESDFMLLKRKSTNCFRP